MTTTTVVRRCDGSTCGGELDRDDRGDLPIVAEVETFNQAGGIDVEALAFCSPACAIPEIARRTTSRRW